MNRKKLAIILLSACFGITMFMPYNYAKDAFHESDQGAAIQTTSQENTSEAPKIAHATTSAKAPMWTHPNKYRVFPIEATKTYRGRVLSLDVPTRRVKFSINSRNNDLEFTCAEGFDYCDISKLTVGQHIVVSVTMIDGQEMAFVAQDAKEYDASLPIGIPVRKRISNKRTRS